MDARPHGARPRHHGLEGRSISFQVDPLATGDRRQVNTYPDGTVQTKLFKTNGEETTTAPDGTVTTVLEGPDPRFGMQAPVPAAITIKLPSGLTSNTTMVRMAALSDPADPLSLTRLTEITTANGKAYTSTFDQATRTYTHTSPAGRVLTTVINDASSARQASPFLGLAFSTGPAAVRARPGVDLSVFRLR